MVLALKPALLRRPPAVLWSSPIWSNEKAGLAISARPAKSSAAIFAQ
jgi:hypothetical protein